MSTANTRDDELPRRGRKGMALLCGLVLALLGAGAIYWLADFLPSEEPRQTPSTEGDPRAEQPPWFRDQTAGSGLHFSYRNGEEADQYTILESLGGGVALFDYDGDGRIDVFVTGGGSFTGPKKEDIKGSPCRLYRNLGGWKFQDVTEQTGLNVSWWYTHGAAVADYDCDGWPDLVVTGYGRLALFRNESDGKGGRRFADVTARVGLHDTSWSTSAGWGDVDGDGYPDLYVCHYVDWSFQNNPICPAQVSGFARDVCPPQQFKPLVHALFHNEKGESFRDVSAEHGFRAAGCGLGVVLVDVNDDGRPDIYVANDASDNFLFLNRKGRLEEQGAKAGVAVDDNGRYNGSMGVDAADYDGSGRPSLWVTNFQGELHALYRNLGRGRFYHQSRAAGVAAIGQHLVGFGTGFLDVDNDGWPDLVIAHGHVLRQPSGSTFKQRPVLLRNVKREERRLFQDVSAQGGAFFQTPAVGRGLAIGDLDNDGWPDLVVSHSNAPVVLLRNEAASVAGPAHWLGVRLVGRGNRDVVGSTILVEGDEGRQAGFVKGGGSYLSARDPRLLFGLGPSRRVRLTVKWSWGQSQSWDNLESDYYWELREGQSVPHRLAAPTAQAPLSVRRVARR